MSSQKKLQPKIRPEVIPCVLLPEVRGRIEKYAEELREAAPKIGSHGLTIAEFIDSGIFQGAVERLRGTQAATTHVKRQFLEDVLTYLKSKNQIRDYKFTGAGDRHDYQIHMLNGRKAVFEAKGCLDGNNTTIFQRPPDADEFFIWSLCQNAGADPRRNAWSGIHTRLGGAILAEKQRVDALVIWDMLCGTIARPCPKLMLNASRATTHPNGKRVPPPCIYLFPHASIPDPRNNPDPPTWKLSELPFIFALATTYGVTSQEIVEVHIQTRMEDADVQRKTSLLRDGHTLHESKWTTLKRAAR